MKPKLPPWAHKALRVAWYRLVLPPARAYSRLREIAGADYSAAPPGHILAQYSIDTPSAYTRIGDKKLAMVLHHLGELGIALPDDARILDFGCGAAGTLCAFHRRFPRATLFGCDLKPDIIDWIKRYRPALTVAANELAPPLPKAFTDFDLVYAISVWTHMPEAACASWIQHMHERIKPGGTLFFTVADPATMARKHGFDPKELSARVKGSGGCFFESGTDMTYIQQEWVEKQIAKRFSLRYFGPLKGHSQSVVVLERLPAARTRSKK